MKLSSLCLKIHNGDWGPLSVRNQVPSWMAEASGAMYFHSQNSTTFWMTR